MRKASYAVVALAVLYSLSVPAAQTPGWIYATSIVSFSPGPNTTGEYANPANALGAPDYKVGGAPEYVSLGNGGTLILKLAEPGIAASGEAFPDIRVVEIGEQGEPVDVYISQNGADWILVGSTISANSLDIDQPTNANTETYYKYVKLIDLPPVQSGAPYAGADIDAVVAIPRTGMEQKGPPSNSCSTPGQLEPESYAGNPVNFSIGNKSQREVDYTFPHGSLQFARTYNSLDGLWRHNHSTYLSFSQNDVRLTMADGRELFFSVSGSIVTSASKDLGVLTKSGTGWEFLSTSNERFTFNSTGQLTKWSTPQGAIQQLAYSGTKVTVTDNLGNTLSFTEDAAHQPLTLTASGVTFTYTYDSEKRLLSVTRSASGKSSQRIYHYEYTNNNALLSGVTDERGVRFSTWGYDDQGRPTSSEHTNGADRVTIKYDNDGSVAVTNEFGRVTKYSFQTIRGVRLISSIDGEPTPNCPNSNSTFTYDARGLLKTRTDAKGNLTTYDYNDRGLETSRTEASGTPQARTVTTEWHPTLFLKTKVTEPDRITTYQYDAQGRQTGQIVTPR
ncbi:DUF6531 domain-containing protein [Pseudomonas nitroreducens]|uniref:DUF6531 domain-containing protein n=1 Tax=Pseudomonas nitroreducens TaxID=46680 RepID=UPI001F5B60A0|nr:DUF6531 domain-containing protein [Pseudomonas nitroreducens]